MKHLLVVLLGLALTATAHAAPKKNAKPQSAPATEAGADADGGAPTHNALFGYTHLLPSPFTLSQGTLVFGTDVAYGVFDFLQIGTNVLRDAYGYFNANAKVSLIDYHEFALGAYLGWENFSYREIDPKVPDVRLTTWMPGVVTAFEILPSVAGFVGGNLAFTSVDVVTDGIAKSGYAHGATGEVDLSWAYNPPASNGVGNALSAGATYDFTYKIFGFGLSHHWTGFHIGLHYYLNADQRRFQPILAGGGVISL